MGDISFSCHRLTDLDGLAADWRDLESRADGGFFLSWDWIGCWLACLDAEVTVFEGRKGEMIVCLGLFCAKNEGGLGGEAAYLHQTGESEADRIAIEYNGLLLDPAVTAARALPALYAEAANRWDAIFLRGLAQDFAKSVAAGTWPARLRAKAPTVQVDLAALRSNDGSYLEQRSANTRGQIRRAIRQYEARGDLRLEVAENAAEALSFFDAMSDMHQRTWHDRDGEGAFSSAFSVAFHRRLIETCYPKGRVELLRLSAGETVIAYLYNFIDGKTVRYYSSGFLYEADNRLKPGMVAHTLCIEHYLATGMDRYDFMAGEARYKTSLGEVGPDILSYLVERPGARQSIKGALRWVRDQVERKG